MATVNKAFIATYGVNTPNITTNDVVAGGTSVTVVNATATNVQFAGAATTLNIATGGASAAIAIGSGTSTVTVGNNLTVTGDLVVQGNTVTINTSTLDVEDKNITMGNVATPSNTTADGGGITLKGATDKTFNWVNSTTAWTSSENIDVASGKAYEIAGSQVLNASGAFKLVNAVTFNSTGGAVAGSTFNGSAGLTVDYSTIGAAASGHTHGSYNRATSALTGANVFNDIVVSNGIVTSTNTRALTKSDIGLSNVENTALSTWAGTSNITTVGTITSGTWNGTDIAVADGGTGVSTLTSGYVVTGNGTGAVIMVSRSGIDNRATFPPDAHTHNYAGSASAGGPANSVANPITLKFNSGTTEGTDLYTFNGSAGKTVDIKPGTGIAFVTAANSITINSTLVVNSGTLNLAYNSANTAGTNNALGFGTNTGFNANSNGNTVYEIKAGPALISLATAMGNGTLGFVKKTGVDTFGFDTNTYLTNAVTSITAGTGLTGGTINSTGTIAVNIGNGAGQVAAGDHNHASLYQPLDSDLTAIAALTPTADNFIVGNGTSWTLETPANARTSLGLGNAAVLNTGITAGTVALGDHTHATLYQPLNATLNSVAAGTYSGDDSIVTVGTITAGTWNATTIATGKGGTGLTTYAKGDILYASAANTLSALTLGVDGYILTSNATSGIPEWKAASGAGYIGTTAVQQSSAAQALTGITSVALENGGIYSFTASTSSTTPTTIATIPGTGAKVYIKASSAGAVHITELLATGETTNLYLTEFATVMSGTALGTFSGTFTSTGNGNIAITVTAASATATTYKVVATSLL